MYANSHKEPIDDSVSREKPCQVDLANSGLISGLQMAVATMRKNELALFVIHHSHGFGDFGLPPRVPGKALLLVALELKDFFKAGTSKNMISNLSSSLEGDNPQELTFREVRKKAIKNMKNGKKFWREKDWYTASLFYQKGIDLLTSYRLKNFVEQAKQQRVLLALHQNLAACGIKIARPALTCIHAREALEIKPDNPKALYHFGCAKLMLEDASGAVHLLTKVVQMRPNSSRAREKLHRAMEEKALRDRLALNVLESIDNLASSDLPDLVLDGSESSADESDSELS
eukprot:TRINITY_DN3792_c0_g1_i1.p1 TRINITY_DN3792_c0_g1~~TRINITY_DN3792_c0_g1_i1.p1  ORF type:complete len:328 (-),score=92.78 TRINITY_DN3792_c0_g1_i1:269-1129(-)